MADKNDPLIFVVEDNIAFGQVVEHYLIAHDYVNVKLFVSGEECLKCLHLKPDIIVQDYKLQGISGLNVLKRTKKILPNTEFIFLSGQDNIDLAVDTIKAGAFDFIVKNDVALQRLLQKIESIRNIQQKKERNQWQKFFLMWLIILVLVLIGLIVVMGYTR
jgi:DNA-binding NtrC family response regulator